MNRLEINFKRTCYLIKSDVRRRIENDGNDSSLPNFLFALFSPSVILVILFRLQSFFYHKRIYILSKLISIMNLVLFSSEIHSKCQIDEGFVVGHANGVGIHDQTIIGKNFTMMHQSTITLKDQKDVPIENLYVVLEDDVLLESGSRILGPCTIGKGSRIGMNSVVTKSVPPYLFVEGIPAKSIGRQKSDADLFPKITGTPYNTQRTNFLDTLRLIHDDQVNRCRVEGRTFDRWVYIKMLFRPSSLAVLIFRFVHWMDGLHLSWIAKAINTINSIVFKTKIGVQAEIEGGLVLVHGDGIVIDGRTKIGKNAVLFHHNTVIAGPQLGIDPSHECVRIGDNTVISPGVRIVGNIVIGNNCYISMNAVVTHSFPDNSVAAGIPAKIVKSLDRVTHSQCFNAYPSSHAKSHEKELLKDMLLKIRDDIAFRAEIDAKPCSLYYYLKIPFNPAILVVILFRISHWFSSQGMHIAPKFLLNLNKLLFSVEIDPEADIGPGLFIAHASGIHIHKNTTIGKRCILTFQNTLTIAPHLELDPVKDRVILGDHVFVGMGARIVGNIHVGHYSHIFANAVVSKSLSNRSLCTGVIARDKSRNRKKLATAV